MHNYIRREYIHCLCFYVIDDRINFRKASIFGSTSLVRVLLLIYVDEIKREKMILINKILINLIIFFLD